jgi:hypothetical protein
MEGCGPGIITDPDPRDLKKYGSYDARCNFLLYSSADPDSNPYPLSLNQNLKTRTRYSMRYQSVSRLKNILGNAVKSNVGDP